VSALGDESKDVRRSACQALGKIGEKAATNEVISKLMSALGDESEDVRESACEAVRIIGEKAATNEVISKLVVLINSGTDYVPFIAAKAVGDILRTFTVKTQLAPNIMSDLCFCKFASECLRNISAEQLVNFFLTTNNPEEWLSAVTQLTLPFEVAVTVTADKVVIYGTKEPLEVSIQPSLRARLVEALTDQAKRLHLYSRISLEP
jgi:HEAT repeat protein